MSTNAVRFGKYVRERRLELELSQMDVWQSGGPSNTTLTKIENGTMETLNRTTAKNLDVSLRWVDGSARATHLGGEPTPLSVAPGSESLVERVRRAKMPEPLRQEILRELRDVPPAPPEPERHTSTG